MESKTIADLPYDVFEIILPLLDGISVLSVSCVCKIWNKWCSLYLRRISHLFWKTICLRELDRKSLLQYSSGNLEENWLAVYKCSCLENTIRYRKVQHLNIPFVQRFIRFRTGVHFLGHMLIVTQGPLINMYDVLTGAYIGTQQVGHFNIHNTFVIKKTLLEETNTDRLDTEDSEVASGLPCDVLVMLCGGAKVTHLAVTTAHTIVSAQPHMIPCDGSLTQPHMIPCDGSLRNVTCSGGANHIVFPFYCLVIEVGRDEVKLSKIKLCSGDQLCFVEKPDPRKLMPFNKNIECCNESSEEVTIFNIANSDAANSDAANSDAANSDAANSAVANSAAANSAAANSAAANSAAANSAVANSDPYHRIQLDGNYKHGTSRIIHVGDEIIPIFAALVMNSEHGKQLHLYSFPLD